MHDEIVHEDVDFIIVLKLAFQRHLFKKGKCFMFTCMEKAFFSDLDPKKKLCTAIRY